MCWRKISKLSNLAELYSKEVLVKQPSQTGESFVPLHPSLRIRSGRNPLHNLIFLDRYIKKKKEEKERGQLSSLFLSQRYDPRFSIRSILSASFCRIDKRINKANHNNVKYYPFDQLIPFTRANPPRSTCLHHDSFISFAEQDCLLSLVRS